MNKIEQIFPLKDSSFTQRIKITHLFTKSISNYEILNYLNNKKFLR